MTQPETGHKDMEERKNKKNTPLTYHYDGDGLREPGQTEPP